MHWRNRRVLQLPGDPRLIEEPPRRRGVGRVALLENLHRHVAVEGDFPGAVDDAHAAGTDLFEQLVARRRNRGDGPCG